MLILLLLLTDTQTFKCNSPLILTKPESVAIEKSMKNHIWIIKGTLPKGRFSWPVLEVQPRVSKLYCPGQDKAKLIMPEKVQTCPDYPTMNGKEIKATLGKSNL